ncbi:P-loop containing nucleoside triphosphate hydrolase protein [Trichoderma camerunense]
MHEPDSPNTDGAQDGLDPLDSTSAVGSCPSPLLETPPLSGSDTEMTSSPISNPLNTSPDDTLQEVSVGSEQSRGSDYGTWSCDSDDDSNASKFIKISQPPSIKPTEPVNPFRQKNSAAAQEWDCRKQYGENSNILDELMQYQGLEEVKQHFLNIKSKVAICKEQDTNGKMNILKLERFNAVFQGNPGTGKTTIARLYAKFLYEAGILQSQYIKETTGVQVASEGAKGMKLTIQDMTNDEDGGVIFVDEAYQLMTPYMDRDGKQALDILLAALESNIGVLSAVFVGYKDEMEPFFEHNPGLESRIPYSIKFTDFDDGELWHIFTNNILKHYGGGMRVEGGLDGVYVRIAIRRLAQGRGNRGFGNARAVENLLARIRQRQAQRLMRERNGKRGQSLDCLFFTKEDLIGPDPSAMARNCPAWIKLQELIGLEEVKQSAERLIGMIELNYQKELREEPPLKLPLNQVFVGSPGTGKTTVAKLYGQILADLGFLSRGDTVLKTPADFIGNCLGMSEAKTKAILESTVGKVLVIDEAYMLDAGNSQKNQDTFKTGIIDTIVSMTQGVPGEDRCIILIGYEDKIRDLFQNANPGFSRRFPVKHPFHFKDFTISQLEEILRLKILEDGLICTDDAIAAARELLKQALMRPNFTNAGEVNGILTAAKMNYESRISRLPLKEKLHATALEAIDFDPEFIQREIFELNHDQSLKGLVNSHIIDQLAGYQRSYIMAKKHKLDPRSFVLTNFIFKGPPGTGKKTAACHLGKMFYNMGFVSTKEVVECSATDLIGQYVGQTAPKTRKKLLDALGRVLVISESGRLMSGSFAAEAVEELLQFLANASNSGKMVVILTGLTTDMNKLLEQYPTLSGLFPEQLVFETMSPDNCIDLFLRELEGSGISAKVDSLKQSSSEDYCKVRHLFRSLGAISGWSNARDVKNLARQVMRRAISAPHPGGLPHELSITCVHVTECMEQMKAQRNGLVRASSNSSRLSNGRTNEVEQQAMAPPQARQDFYSNMRQTMDKRFSLDTSALHQPSVSYKTSAQLNSSTAQKAAGSTIDGEQNYQSFPSKDTATATREEGVSDEDWQNLCKMKKEQTLKSQLQTISIQTLERQLKSFEEKGDGINIERFRERLTEAQKKKLEEEKIQKALQEMGRCEYGFAWVREGEGYRCEGGSHYVSDAQLAERL